MKYNINLNQRALIELSPEITLSEAVILDYIYFICSSVNQKIINERKDGYTWIDYSSMLENLPLLEGRTKPTITPKIKNLEKFGYIKTKEIYTKTGTRKYVILKEKIGGLFSYLNEVIKLTKGGHLDNLMYNNNIYNNNKDNKDIVGSASQNTTLNQTSLSQPPEEDTNFDFNSGNHSSYKRILGPEDLEEKTTWEDLLEFWNEQDIIKHAKLSPFVEKYGNKLLKENFSVMEMKKSIRIYGEVINHPQSFFKYRWTLYDFLCRENGCRNFLDKKLEDYLIKKNNYN